MDEGKLNQVVNNMMKFLKENGWAKTLQLIEEIQQRKDYAAQQVLKRFGDCIASSGNGEYIYRYAQDVEGADLQKLHSGMNKALDNLAEVYDYNKKEYKKWEKYNQDICKMIEKRTHKLSSDDILSSIDNL